MTAMKGSDEEMDAGEDAPLLDGRKVQRAPFQKMTSRSSIALIAVSIVALLLAMAVVILAAFLAKNLKNDSDSLPIWPAPSTSPLGVYYKAAVASDNGLCSEIGRNVMMIDGGNAVDAAIATAICIGVMDAHSSGLGGGHFAVIFNKTTGECTSIDAREVAPNAATRDMYKNDAGASKTGWKAIGVPGELAGLLTAYRIGATLPWKRLLQPTIEYLDMGYPVSPPLAKALAQNKAIIEKEKTLKIFLNNKTGQVYNISEVMRRPVLAETLRQLANHSDPMRLFYNGSLTAKMVQEFQANGGLITEQDFHDYQALIRPTIYSHLLNGVSICGLPPPAGSSIASSIINVFNGYGPAKLSTVDENVENYHRIIEAMKFAYAARSEMGDLSFGQGNLSLAENVTSSWFADWVQSQITDKAHTPEYYGGSFSNDDHGTAHISVLDAQGNAVSLTSTINLYLGSKRRSESTGIIWNDEMDDFSSPGQKNSFGYPASAANFIYPGKRPLSSMSPLILFRNKSREVEMVVGAAGGSRIISSVAYTTIRTLDFNETIKQAIDAPRLHNQLYPPYTRYDKGFPKAYVDGLRARGQNMTDMNVGSVVTGIHRKNGLIFANSDIRKGTTSLPAGY